MLYPAYTDLDQMSGPMGLSSHLSQHTSSGYFSGCETTIMLHMYTLLVFVGLVNEDYKLPITFLSSEQVFCVNVQGAVFSKLDAHFSPR